MNPAEALEMQGLLRDRMKPNLPWFHDESGLEECDEPEPPDEWQ